MSAQNTSARLSAAQVTGAKARAYEIAQLRAQRVARRSAEVASGQRRMALAGVLVGLLVVVASGATFAVVSWLWTLLPIAGLALVLVFSRRAAVAADRADRADRQRLAELKSQSRSAHSSVENSVALPGVAPVVRADGEEEMSPMEEAKSSLDENVSPEGSVSEVLEDEKASSESAEETVVVAEETPAEKAWTPTPLPVSRYSQGARVEGRVVHADTDLRGIPRVKASVPARPIAATVDTDARSTDEVARSIPLAFDLDEILEARRA